MEFSNRTIMASFSSLNEARSAVAELKNAGFHDVRLVENDDGMPSTDNRSYESAASRSSEDRHETGVLSFFSRLFGMDDSAQSRTWSPDSDKYFRMAYQRKHHLVVVSGVDDTLRCKEILTSFEGRIEDEGSRYFEQERKSFSEGGYARANLTDDAITSEDRVMELREEQLEVGKERVQSGEVNLRKEIVTEIKTVEVPLTREEIVVERRSLDGIPREGSLSMSEDGRTEEIRIPVSEEHVHIEKKVVPREEVRISKERFTDTETVSEEVRREEARIEAEGRVRLRNEQDALLAKTKKPQDGRSTQPGL